MSRNLPMIIVAGILFGSGVISGWGISRLTESSDLTASNEISTHNSTSAELALSVSGASSSFITTVAEQVGPAVVRIESQRSATSVNDEPRNPFEPPFFEEPGESERYTPYGTGSGFIIDAAGTILTNAHVVEGSEQVTVVLQDGRIFDGIVKGSDPVTDIAVISVEGENLPTVTLGDSDSVRPGAWAIAIGNPLGLDSSVTAGIISAIGRSSGEVGAPDKRVAFIQTDAAINPGNSGGPLLNADGQVIGVNTAIFRRAQGVGFAIPINRVREISDQLISTGKAEHAFLGIRMVTLTADFKDIINDDPTSDLIVETDQGVLIAEVLPDSPAQASGLKSGDVITQLGEVTITEAQQVQELVEAAGVGSVLRLIIKRGNQDLAFEVKTSTIPTAALF